MTKSTRTYWNALDLTQRHHWQPIAGLEGMAEEITLSIDPDSGNYTRLTRFHPGADTSALGGKSHAYPEEIFIVSGRLYDQAFDLWLESSSRRSSRAVQNGRGLHSARDLFSQSGGVGCLQAVRGKSEGVPPSL
jgi:hypothetical protein